MPPTGRIKRAVGWWRKTNASPGCASFWSGQHQVQDPNEFLHTVKGDLFTEEVYVFTPKGDLHDFPQGASVVDFAYRVHSEVGNHCTAARVNGRLVPLRYQLRNGDTVEIVTKPSQTPSKDWLKLVKTPKAQARIRQWVKAQQRERSVLPWGANCWSASCPRHQFNATALRKQGQTRGRHQGPGL